MNEGKKALAKVALGAVILAGSLAQLFSSGSRLYSSARASETGARSQLEAEVAKVQGIAKTNAHLGQLEAENILLSGNYHNLPEELIISVYGGVEKGTPIRYLLDTAGFQDLPHIAQTIATVRAGKDAQNAAALEAYKASPAGRENPGFFFSK